MNSSWGGEHILKPQDPFITVQTSCQVQRFSLSDESSEEQGVMLLGGDDTFQYFWMIVLISKLYRRRGGRLIVWEF